MKFTSIEITNFGILADVDLLLESAGSGNVAFVNGRNGRGKTSFQAAIRWCIYGLNDSDKWLSHWAVEAAKTGTEIEMAVELGIQVTPDGEVANIKRQQLFEKAKDGGLRRVGQERVVVRTVDSGGLAEVLPKPEVWLQKYFPERFMNFFLFDGELMKNFFDSRVKGAIENAVREIAGVDYFEEVSKKLELTKTAIDKTIAKKSGGEAERVRKTLEDARTLVLRVSESIARESRVLEELEEELKGNEKKWAGVEEAARNVERNNEIKKLLEEKKAHLSRSLAEFNDLALRAGSMANLSVGLTTLLREIESAHIKGTLPPPFNPASLQHLLDASVCICGNDLAAGSLGEEEIKKLIKNFEKSSVVGKKLDATGRAMEIATARIEADYGTLTARNEQIISLREEIRTLQAEQETLTDDLGADGEVSLATLGTRIRELNKLIPDKRVDLADAKKDLEQRLIPAQEKAQADFDAVAANADEVRTLSAESKLAGELAQAAGAIHSIALQLVRERLEESISAKFKIVKEGSFVTRVTEDFEVLTLNDNGSEASLSEGEKMMKAYIFSIALREVVGLSFPLVVDTPFGRLDEFYREELAVLLAELVRSDSNDPNRQVIFLMHDGEYTPYTKKHFDKTNPLETFLAWEKDEKKSFLGSGIDPDWFTTTAWKDWKAGKIK